VQTYFVSETGFWIAEIGDLCLASAMGFDRTDGTGEGIST